MTSTRDPSSIGSPASTSRQAVTFAGRVLQCINLGRSWAAIHPIPAGFVACFATLMFFALIYGGASSEEDAEVEAAQKPALATEDTPPPKSEGEFFVKERTEQASEQRARSLPAQARTQPDMETRARESELGHSIACVLRAYAENGSSCKNTELAALARAVKAGDATYTYKNKTRNWAEQFASDGVEWILWLLADAKIPLLTVHSYLVGFPEPACVPITEMIPKAVSAAEDAKSQGGLGNAMEFKRSEWKYDSLAKITPDEAKIALVFPRYAVRRDSNLVFRSLNELSPESAVVLATHKHSLEFPSMVSLPLESARALAQHRGGFSRTGAVFDDSVTLGLSELSPPVAAAIAGKKGSLQIGTKDRPLKTLSRETAESLARFRGRALTLWVDDVPPDAQDALAACGSRIHFAGGPSTLSSTKLVQKLIEGADGGLISLGCGRMTPDTASTLRATGDNRDVVFSQDFSCDEPIGRILADYPGQVTFMHLVSTTPQVMAVLKESQAKQHSSGQVEEETGKAGGELLGLLGCTEEELVRVYGPVFDRLDNYKQASETIEPICFFQHGILVRADMKRGRCQLIQLFPIENDKNLHLNKGMHGLIGEKLCEWTGLSDWENAATVSDSIMLAWKSRSANVFAAVLNQEPCRIWITRGRESEWLASVQNADFNDADGNTIENSIGMKMRHIPAGTLRRDDLAAEGIVDEPIPVKASFYLAAHETTNLQWRKVMGSVPSHLKDDDQPVEQVSWGEAIEFCRKLSSLPAEQKAGRVYRLPTEVEWEYACRAGARTKYSFGDKFMLLFDHGWFLANAQIKTHAVGQKKPNAWGLYDMHGNVVEWCNGSGTGRTQLKVVRGGSFFFNAEKCSSAFSITVDPDAKSGFCGFRIALSPSGAESTEAGK